MRNGVHDTPWFCVRERDLELCDGEPQKREVIVIPLSPTVLLAGSTVVGLGNVNQGRRFLNKSICGFVGRYKS